MHIIDVNGPSLTSNGGLSEATRIGGPRTCNRSSISDNVDASPSPDAISSFPTFEPLEASAASVLSFRAWLAFPAAFFELESLSALARSAAACARCFASSRWCIWSISD